MDYNSLLAGAIGIGPALLLMLLTFERYTYPKVERPFFDDRKVFMIFTLGMIIGVVMASLIRTLDRGDILVVIALAVAQQLVFLVILMLKRFALRLDTTFYGASLGFGIGSTMAFFASYQVLAVFDQETVPWETYLIITILAFQIVCISAVTGTLIGIGSAKGKPWSYLWQAILVQVGYYLLLVPLYAEGDGLLTYATFAFATFFAVYCYLYIHRKAIPDIIKEALERINTGPFRRY